MNAATAGLTGKGYFAALAAGTVFWIVVRQAIHAHWLPRINSTIFYCLVAVTWNAVSIMRIGKAYWQHLAPYVTLAALYGLSWALIANGNQYAIGGHPPTLLDTIIFYLSLPLLGVWPIAAVYLCARRRSH